MSKKKVKKSNAFKVITVGTLILLVFGLVAYRLSHTMAIFNVRSVEVRGNKVLPRDRVMLYSGIAIGENIFQVDSREVQMNLKSDPYVRSVEVSKKLPSGIHLAIEENKDVVVIDAGEKVYLSQEGIVLSKSSDFRGYFVPLLEGISIPKDTVVSNELEYENDIEKDEFLTFLNGLSRSSIHNRLSHIRVENEMLTMRLSTGEEIAFGEFENVEYKLSYLEEILNDLEEKSKFFEKIDFTRGNRVIVEEKIFGEED